MTPDNAGAALAGTVVDELVRCGVQEIVLAPGSRSAALAFAAHAAAEAGRVRLHVRVDERSAGFLALGMAKVSRRPVPVVTTSGTAVANLHPAVLEASSAGVPLVVVSADRPAALRGTKANQTTDQVKLFGAAVRCFADVPPGCPGAGERDQVGSWRSLVARALAAAGGRLGQAAGPVHLNLQLAEPLVPDVADGWCTPIEGRPHGAPWTDPGDPPLPQREPVDLGLRTVVVAGDDAGPAARVAAEFAGWPLLAEPTSGARTGGNAIRTYRVLLGDDTLARRIQRVVLYGHPTLSRPVTRLLSRDDVEVIAVAGPGGWTDPGRRVSRVVGALQVGREPAARSPEPPVRTSRGPRPGPWLGEWLARDAELSARLDALLARQGELAPQHVAAAVSAAVPPGGLLFVGGSNPVRDLDLMAARYPVGERRRVIANRGLSGIDGAVSTAIGAALARRDSARAFALLGDLTFLHDANGLLAGPAELRPDLMVVVVNDDGGSLFASLEQGGPSYASVFERIFGTPLGADLGALCRASGTVHRRVTSLAGLQAAIGSPSGGTEVVEALVRRDNRREVDAAIRDLESC